MKIIGVVVLFMFILAIPSTTAIVKITDPAIVVQNFLDLLDTPATFAGDGGDCLKVNVGETAIEFGGCTVGGESKAGTGYLFNNTITMFLNDTLLNQTIDNRSNLFNQSLNKEDDVRFRGINITNSSGTNGLFVNQDGQVSINSVLGSLLHAFTLTGAMDLIHSSTEQNDHALEILLNANGFGDSKAILIEYITGALAAETNEEVILINIDKSETVGGHITGIEILSTEGPAKVTGMEVGVEVGPIVHLSGIFGDMDSALNNSADVLTAFTSTTNNISLFVSDNDFVTIGNDEKFEEIEFLLDNPASGAGIKPAFYHSDGVDVWHEFVPADGTNGMRSTGVIIWELEDLDEWNVGLNSEFLIRINRTANALTTPPKERKVQIAGAIEYFWNKTGDVFVRSVKANDWSNITVTESQVSDLTHTVDTNLSNGGNVLGSFNVSENVTVHDTLCFIEDCSIRIFYNGSRLIGIG